jgi:DNA-binding NarL/FixJ family response regulator
MTTSAPPIRLLIVEDHQMTLMGLELLLQKEEGLDIVGKASDGLAAVRLADQTRPDLILMDIGLPEMDGIEATQKIKQQHPGTKVLMLTSKDNERDVFAALAAGADAYCMKGISPATLTSAIYSVAEGAGWLDPAIARLVLGRFQKNGPGVGNQGMVSGGGSIAPLGPPIDCPLTPREMEVLALIVDGQSNADIAEILVITKATAKAHVHSILQKLCVDDRTQAAVLAMRQGLVAG